MTILNLKCPKCGNPHSYDVPVPPDENGEFFTCANDDCSHVFQRKETPEG